MHARVYSENVLQQMVTQARKGYAREDLVGFSKSVVLPIHSATGRTFRRFRTDDVTTVDAYVKAVTDVFTATEKWDVRISESDQDGGLQLAGKRLTLVFGQKAGKSDNAWIREILDLMLVHVPQGSPLTRKSLLDAHAKFTS